MEGYVLLYHFEDKGAVEYFEGEINKTFWRNRTEESNGFKYFGFTDREAPGVVDKLNEIVDQMGIGTKDYVALYYSRKEDPERIKQQMIIGHDDLVETKVQDISFDAHRNSLTKLLNFDYLKVQSQPAGKG